MRVYATIGCQHEGIITFGRERYKGGVGRERNCRFRKGGFQVRLSGMVTEVPGGFSEPDRVGGSLMLCKGVVSRGGFGDLRLGVRFWKERVRGRCSVTWPSINQGLSLPIVVAHIVIPQYPARLLLTFPLTFPSPKLNPRYSHCSRLAFFAYFIVIIAFYQTYLK